MHSPPEPLSASIRPWAHGSDDAPVFLGSQAEAVPRAWQDEWRDDFRDLFEEAPIPYVHEALDSRFIRVNRAARTLLGLRADEVPSIYGRTLVAPTAESQARVQEVFAAVRAGLERVGVVLELRRKDNGATVWVEWSSTLARDGSYMRTMLVDISHRVLLEQTKLALEFSLESGQVGDWDLDLLSDTSRRSLRHDRCFGYDQCVPEAAWGAQAFVQHVHPADRERVQSTMRDAVANLRDWQAEFRVVWPDSSVHWLVAKGRIYRTTEDGRAARMLGVVMDVTERKRGEEALAASEQLARGQVEALTRTLESLAMEFAPDRLLEHVLCTITEQLGAHSTSVWRCDDTTGLVMFHASYEAGPFFTRTEPTLGAAELSLPLDPHWVWSGVFQTGKPVIMEDLRVMPNFPWRERLLALGVVTVLVMPMVMGGQVNGAIGIRFTRLRTFTQQEVDLAQALTNQATLSMQLTKLSAQSREAAVTAERNRMAREIHDTLAQGLTGVIVQLEAAADAQVHGLAVEVEQHLARAKGLARESLTEARRSVRALRPKEFDDKDLCEALEALVRKMTAGTGVHAEWQVQGTPAQLRPEWEDNLLGVVKEVLTNVLRHAGASRFEATIRFEPHLLRLDLRDNGRGFDPSAKCDGFGLIGVHERVASMQGRITLHSRPGVRKGPCGGTHFAITVPLGAGR